MSQVGLRGGVDPERPVRRKSHSPGKRGCWLKRAVEGARSGWIGDIFGRRACGVCCVGWVVREKRL